MWPDRISNPGPPTYEPGALPTVLHGPAQRIKIKCVPNDSLCSIKMNTHKICLFLSISRDMGIFMLR